jgi:hypothetical protein
MRSVSSEGVEISDYLRAVLWRLRAVYFSADYRSRLSDRTAFIDLSRLTVGDIERQYESAKLLGD